MTNPFPDPLHPREQRDLRSLIRRKLTTLSTFGSVVEEFLNAADDLAVDYVDALKASMDFSAKQLSLDQCASSLTSSFQGHASMIHCRKS